MAHRQNRSEPGWDRFRFEQPYARGLQRLREEVLGKIDFDPATFWQWGTMQAMALIEILKSAEQRFGAEGQQMVYEALRKVGYDIGRQILEGVEPPEGASKAERVFDCRVQRYFVQGMIDAARETGIASGFAVRFDSTIPAGAPTCHFTLWKASEDERAGWEETTRLIDEKALARANREKSR